MPALHSRLALTLWLGFALVALPTVSQGEVSASITIAPPPLPVYDQPPIPGPGYLWAPGYWAYGPGGYFWVPGTWVEPPEIGLLWTPGFWSWNAGMFVWNAGYWGPHVGFYGGVNYGFGYAGHGYEGGEWRGRQLFYNRSVNNVTVSNITNVYTKTVVQNTTMNHVSFNGGEGGIRARPTADEQAAAREPHRAPTPIQGQHRAAASSRRELLASENQGRPSIAATAKPTVFSGGVIRARSTGAPGGAPVARRAASGPPPEANTRAPRPDVHASENSRAPARPPVSTGSAERNQLIAKQRTDLQARHERERNELQRRQTHEHERAAPQRADASRANALERQHPSQTQALQQRYATEQQRLERTQQHPVAHEPSKEPPHRPTGS
jgi:hypothetical protein